MTKRKTNVEKVVSAMEQSKYGAMSQLFIMEAIGRYADEVAKSLPEDYDVDCFVNPRSWIGVAKEIQSKLDT